MSFCTQCGGSLSPADRFCSRCGKSSTQEPPRAPGISLEKKPPQLTPSPTLPPAPSSPSPAPAASPPSAPVQIGRPWVRYWARMTDIVLFSIPAALMIGWIAPEFLNAPGSDNALGLLIVFLWVFVESALLSVWGTTPGKALLRVRFILTSGTSLSFSQALSRSFKVWWRGLAIGLPIIFLFTANNAYKKLKANQPLSWDAETGIIVMHDKIGAARITALVVIMTIYIGLVVLGSIPE